MRAKTLLQNLFRENIFSTVSLQKYPTVYDYTDHLTGTTTPTIRPSKKLCISADQSIHTLSKWPYIQFEATLSGIKYPSNRTAKSIRSQFREIAQISSPVHYYEWRVYELIVSSLVTEFIAFTSSQVHNCTGDFALFDKLNVPWREGRSKNCRKIAQIAGNVMRSKFRLRVTLTEFNCKIGIK